tara:strand:+ start:220 stop:993 length:774 start_codon:yes stop_codon:yes gene_type:complete
MNILPDSLKLNYEPEPAPAPATPSAQQAAQQAAEPNIKEVISEAGEVMASSEKQTEEIDDSIPLDTDDDAINQLEMPTFVPKPKPDITMFEDHKPVKLTRKGKPRKPMSQEHKDKLAIARVKANAKRSYLKAERDKAKAEAKEGKKKEKPVPLSVSHPVPIIEKVKEEITEQTEQTVVEEQVYRPPTPKLSRQSNITLEDLEKAQLNTILTIERMRKDRKEEKKKKQLEEQYKKDTIKTINKINNWQETAGIYQNCF